MPYPEIKVVDNISIPTMLEIIRNTQWYPHWGICCISASVEDRSQVSAALFITPLSSAQGLEATQNFLEKDSLLDLLLGQVSNTGMLRESAEAPGHLTGEEFGRVPVSACGQWTPMFTSVPLFLSFIASSL